MQKFPSLPLAMAAILSTCTKMAERLILNLFWLVYQYHSCETVDLYLNFVSSMWLCFRIYHSSLAEHKIGITENKTLTIFLPLDLISMVKKFLFTIISYNSPTKLTLCNCTVCRNFESAGVSITVVHRLSLQ